MVARLLRLRRRRRPTTPPTRSRSRSATSTRAPPRGARARPRRPGHDRAAVRDGRGAPRRPCRARVRRRRLPARGVYRDASAGAGVGERASCCTRIWSSARTRCRCMASQPRRSAICSCMLLGVQSVGPKVALEVLSGGTPRELVGGDRRRRQRPLPGGPGNRQAHGGADHRRIAREGRPSVRATRLRRSP